MYLYPYIWYIYNINKWYAYSICKIYIKYIYLLPHRLLCRLPPHSDKPNPTLKNLQKKWAMTWRFKTATAATLWNSVLHLWNDMSHVPQSHVLYYMCLRDCCIKCANRFSPNFAQAYLLGRNAVCISLDKQLTLSLLLLLLLCAQSSARMPMCPPSFFPKKKPHWQTVWGTTACSYKCNLLTPASPTNSRVSELFNIFNWFSKTALHLAKSCFLRNRRAPSEVPSVRRVFRPPNRPCEGTRMKSWKRVICLLFFRKTLQQFTSKSWNRQKQIKKRAFWKWSNLQEICSLHMRTIW